MPTPPDPTIARLLRAMADALKLDPGNPSTGAERMFTAVAEALGKPEATYAEVRAALIKILDSESK